MVTSGIGSCLPYVAFHTTLFERLIALFRDKANIGFLMYLPDAFSYPGVCHRAVAQELRHGLDFPRATINTSLTISGVCLIAVGVGYQIYRARLNLPRVEAHEAEPVVVGH